jgi:hypothetical protein
MRLSINGWTLEHGISPPTSGHRSGGRNNIYPWSEMEIGESFFVPGAKQKSLSSIARNWAVRHKPAWVFSCAAEKDGARIWRIA